MVSRHPVLVWIWYGNFLRLLSYIAVVGRCILTQPLPLVPLHKLKFPSIHTNWRLLIVEYTYSWKSHSAWSSLHILPLITLNPKSEIERCTFTPRILQLLLIHNHMIYHWFLFRIVSRWVGYCVLSDNWDFSYTSQISLVTILLARNGKKWYL